MLKVPGRINYQLRKAAAGAFIWLLMQVPYLTATAVSTAAIKKAWAFKPPERGREIDRQSSNAS
jgi:hypothetical protein